MLKMGRLIAGVLLLISSNVFSAANVDHQYENVSVTDAQKLIVEHQGNSEFELLDVRTSQEFNQAHIKGARKIDFYAPDFAKNIQSLDRNKTYLVYCRSGNRSAKTLALMEQLGFKKVYNMQGGVYDWHQQRLPLETEK